VPFETHAIDEAVFMASRVVVMSARPGRIKLDRRVDLPHPRHYAMKTTPVFMELEAELTEQVRAEVPAEQSAAAWIDRLGARGALPAGLPATFLGNRLYSRSDGPGHRHSGAK
jgi:hypothetical protein